MAIRVVSSSNDGKSIKMSEMKPMQGGVVVDDRYTNYLGDYVLRTQSKDKFEVMNLSDPQPGYSWRCESNLKIRLLKGPVTIEIDGR